MVIEIEINTQESYFTQYVNEPELITEFNTIKDHGIVIQKDIGGIQIPMAVALKTIDNPFVEEIPVVVKVF